MNYSGVLVSAFPGRYDEMLRELDTIEGVEVHQQDPDRNRCIIVIEAPDVTAEVDLFKAVSTLSGVADVALIVHNFEDDAVVCSSNT